MKARANLLVPRVWLLSVFLLLYGVFSGGGEGVVNAQVLPITVVVVLPLDFGICDMVPGILYIVDPAPSPGAGACTGAHAARFEVTGDPNAKIIIAIPTPIFASNGTENIKVRGIRSSEGKKSRLDATGALTLYVGGKAKIRNGGLATYGLFSVVNFITVNYR